MVDWTKENQEFLAAVCTVALVLVTAVYAMITMRTLSVMRAARDRDEARWRIETVASFVASARTASALYQDSVQPAEHLLTTYCNQGINSNGFQIARDSICSALDRAEDYRQLAKGMESRLLFVYGTDSDVSGLVEPISKRLDRQRDGIKRCIRWVDKQSSITIEKPDPSGAREGLPAEEILRLEKLVGESKVSVKSRGRVK